MMKDSLYISQRLAGFRPLSGFSFSNVSSLKLFTEILECFRPLSGFSFSNAFEGDEETCDVLMFSSPIGVSVFYFYSQRY